MSERRCESVQLRVPAVKLSAACVVDHPSIPAGCASPVVRGVTYELCGKNWYLPARGAEWRLRSGHGAVRRGRSNSDRSALTH